MDPFIGARVGEWTLTDHIGEGAMGVVYRAEPPAAIKILNARRAALQPDLVRRFEIEAEAVGRLISPHVARVFRSGTTEEGHLYIAMELLNGSPLDEILERTPRVDAAGSISVAYQAAHALSEAHDKQIVHRDLKPANLFVEFGPGGSNHIRVLDFGIARINSGSIARSRTGTVAGSPAYMSPEQLLGWPDIDGRTDIYSLGVVLYEMLAGENPFRCESGVMATLRRHLEVQAPELPRDVPRPLAKLVGEMLVKDREHRLGSMREVCARLEAVGISRFDRGGYPADRPTLRNSDVDDETVIDRRTQVDGLTREVMRLVESQPDIEPAPAPDAPERVPAGARPLVWITAAAMSLGIALLTLWLLLRSAPPVPVVVSEPNPPARLSLKVGPDASPAPPERSLSAADLRQILSRGDEAVRRGDRRRALREYRRWLDAERHMVPRHPQFTRVSKQVEALATPAPLPPPEPPVSLQKRRERLLSRGDRAMRNEDYPAALTHYEMWLGEVKTLQPPHPQLEVIRNRVTLLRDHPGADGAQGSAR